MNMVIFQEHSATVTKCNDIKTTCPNGKKRPNLKPQTKTRPGEKVFIPSIAFWDVQRQIFGKGD